MHQTEPHKLLIDLQKELRQTSFPDPATRERVMNLVDLIDRSVARESGLKTHRTELMQSLGDSLMHLEVSHPSITTAINNIIYTLNNMGV
jgi:hypothetical protein